MSSSDIPDFDVIEDPGGSKTYSYAYITLLYVLVIGSLAGAVYMGYITPDISVSADFAVGWIIEYTIAGLVALFFIWTFAQIANIVGMGFISGLIGVVARIADNYELPERRDTTTEDSEDSEEE